MDFQESVNRFAIPLTGLLISWGMPAIDATELAQDSLADAHLSLNQCRGDVKSPEVLGNGYAESLETNIVTGRASKLECVDKQSLRIPKISTK